MKKKTQRISTISDKENVPALVQLLQDKHSDVNAVKVEKDAEGAIPVGNSFCLIPDCLGVFELAEIVAQ